MALKWGLWALFWTLSSVISESVFELVCMFHCGCMFSEEYWNVKVSDTFNKDVFKL